MSSPAFSLRHARGVASVLNVTFRLLRAHWLLFLKSIFYFGAPPLILGGASFGVGLLAYVLGIEQTGSAASAGPLGGLIIGVGLGAVLMTVGTALAVTGILAVVYLHEEHPDADLALSDVWTITKSRVLGVLGLTLLQMIAIVILVPINVVPCLGALLFLAWTVFITVRVFFLALPIRVIENRSAFAAMSRAYELVRNDFWETASIFLVIYVVQMIISTAFMLPFQIVVYSGELHSLDAESLPGWLLAGFAGLLLLGMAGSVLVSGIMYVAAAVQTYALKERKEEASVEARVERLEAEVSASDASSSEPTGEAPASAGDPPGRTTESSDDEGPADATDTSEPPRL